MSKYVPQLSRTLSAMMVIYKENEADYMWFLLLRQLGFIGKESQYDDV